MISRRQFISASSAYLASRVLSDRLGATPESTEVNDVHSQLNPTRVSEILQPRSLDDVRQIIRTAQNTRKAVSICGGRHAMGGQEFGTDTTLIDVRKLNRIINFDLATGIIEVEGGIEWPQLIDGYLARQSGDHPTWGIAQKQTGADRLTMSGTI